MKKKVLSFILALSMIFGSMGMTFAAPAVFEDIDDSNVAKAVERLKAFNIVDGYEDGTYRPGQDVTREEFAKLLVTALGIDHAASSVTVADYKDVEAGRWSAGYIAVASGQGLIIGDPDGNFRPADKVSYAEAVTMLVRSLGYQDSFLKGTWPGNSVAKAAEVGITSRVRFTDAAGYANRGEVALLVDNTLDAKVVKVDTYEGAVIKYYESDATFLEDKLEIFNLEEVVVTGTPNVDQGINKEQIRVEYTKDLDFKNKTVKFDKNTSDTYDVVEGIEIENLLGLSLNIYIDEYDDVIYVEESRRPFVVLYDVIDKGEDVEEDSITLKNADREYQLETGKNEGDYTIYIDNKLVNFKTFQEEAKDGDLFVKAVLNNKGNIKLIEAHRFDVNGHIVVENKDGIITYFETSEDDEYKVKEKDYDKTVVFDMQGNSMEFEDIEKDDVIYVNDKNLDGNDLKESATKDKVAYILVVRDTKEGKAQSYRWSKNAAIEIDGKFHSVVSENITTVSITEDEKIEIYAESYKDLDDLTAEEGKVTALLNFVGDVRHIRSGVKSSSRDTYGVITGIDTRYSDIYVKILNYDEDTVEYELDLDDAFGYDAVSLVSGKLDSGDNAKNLTGDTSSTPSSPQTNVTKGDIVRYNVNSNGDISEIELLAYFDGSDFQKATANYQSKDLELVLENADAHDIAKRSIKLNGSFHAVKDDVVVFNYTPAYDKATSTLLDPADVEIAEWLDIVDKHVEAGTRVLAVKDKLRNSSELVVFLTDFDAIGNDTFAGYVTNIFTRDGDRFAEIVKPGSNDSDIYELNSKSDYNVAQGFERRNVVVFEEKSSGKVAAKFNDSDFDVITARVVSVRGRSLELDTDNDLSTIEKSYRLDSDAVFYQKGARKTLSDVGRGDYVRVVVEKGMISVVKRYDAKESDVEDLTSGGDANIFRTDYKTDNSGADWANGGGGSGNINVQGTVTGTVYAVDGDKVTFTITEDADGNTPAAGDELAVLTITEDSALVKNATNNGEILENKRAIGLYLRVSTQPFVIDVLKDKKIDVLIEQ